MATLKQTNCHTESAAALEEAKVSLALPTPSAPNVEPAIRDPGFLSRMCWQIWKTSIFK